MKINIIEMIKNSKNKVNNDSSCISLSELSKKMKLTIDYLKDELIKTRDSRPSIEPIEKIQIAHPQGYKTNIRSVAKVYLENKFISISISDNTPKIVNIIDNAIKNTNLGFTTNINGNNIQIFFSDFDKNKIIKIIKNSGESSKLKIKNIRHDYIKNITKAEKNSEISKDESKKLKNNIEKEKDKYNKEIDSMINLKIQNL